MINEWGPICLALNRTVQFGEGRMDCMITSPLLITLLLQPGLTLHPPLALPAANPGPDHWHSSTVAHRQAGATELINHNLGKLQLLMLRIVGQRQIGQIHTF